MNIKKITAVVLSLLAFNIFFYNRYLPMPGTLGFVLLIIVTQATLWLSFYKPSNKEKNNLAFVSTSLSLLLIIISVFRASEVDSMLLTLMSLSLSFSTLYLLSLTHNYFGAVSEIINIPWKIGSRWLENFLGIIPDFFKFLNQSRKYSTKFIPKISIPRNHLSVFARGLVITIPVIGIVLILLSSADPIFNEFISNLFRFPTEVDIAIPKLLISFPQRLIHSLIFLGLVVPLVVLKIDSKFISPLQNKKFGKYRGEMLMLVSALILVLGTFILVQFKYLFATVSEVDLHQFGVPTYSAYVRRGFSEMTLVSIIVYFVSVVSLLVHRAGSTSKNWLKSLNIILLFEMLVFIFSIFRRVILYQAEHGLTRIRVYGTMFLVMIIGLTVILWLRQIKANFKNWYLYEIGVMVTIVLATSLINVDNLVATVFQPTVNNEVDYMYIAKLSPDGIEGWKTVWDNLELVKRQNSLTELSSEIVSELNFEPRHVNYNLYSITSFKRNYKNLIAKYGSDEEKEIAGIPKDARQYTWYEKNLSEYQAYKKLIIQIPYAEVLDSYDYFKFMWEALSAQDKQMNLDRSRETPLL